MKTNEIAPIASGPDALLRLKSSKAGLFYKTHLHTIPIIHDLTVWMWRILYPIYKKACNRHMSRIDKRWRDITKLAAYVKATGAPVIPVFDQTQVDTPYPTVFPTEAKADLSSPHESYTFPHIYVAQLQEALLYGSTNLVFLEDQVICHDLYDFRRDFTSEELHARHIISPKKMRMRLLQSDPTPARVPAAATFLDACASNYAHWITEVLPRVTAFCEIAHLASTPIVINAGLHPNILESLEAIVGPDREVILLPLGRALHVEQLYVTSVAGYVPFERRTTKLGGHSHGLFCPPALLTMRAQILQHIDSQSLQDLPQKIYLRRVSKVRQVVNNDEIEKILLDKGYVAIEPEKLSFMQQVALFANATDIAGSSGAALANLPFCQPSANVNILIGKLHGTSYWYWQNIACASGKRVRYILGKPTQNAAGIHSDIVIDTETLKAALIR